MDHTSHEVALTALSNIANATPVEVAPYLMELMAASHSEYMDVTNMVVEGLEQQIADLQAELGAIRTRINELFAGDYMPNQDAIILAVFYPSKALKDAIKANNLSGEQ